MTQYDYLIAGLIAFVALYFKLRQLRRDPHNPALRAICGILAGLGACVIVGWEPMYVAVDQAAGIPNLARYLEHAFSLVAAASAQSLFLFLGDPDKAPRRAKVRWISLGVAVLAMGVIFSLGSFSEEAPKDFAARYATTPALSQYMLAFLAFLALTMTDILRMSARYGRQLPASLLRFGIRLLVAGSVIGLLYVVHKATFIICAQFDVAFPWAEGPASQAMLLIGIALVAGGLVIPAAGSYLVDAWHWPRRYRLYRDMHPLWEGIHGVVQDLSLHPPRRWPGIRLMSIALYRRVIEIRDGLSELSSYLDPVVVSEANSLTSGQEMPDREARAVAEAAGIAVMLDYYMATSPETRTPLSRKGRNSDIGDAGEDLDADAEWLAAVSRAYAASPIVDKLRRTRRPAEL
ncbi:hypothetical protein JIG36_51135 [Actinoplanes sp. LDG1-06]|uniref:DUF6545 domain-containing protein n=1 Tax=Paractinoplanes ovalisporus TaxID=2810368 RepID=A0ABS2AVK2_9ACTN|nr:MAB_1171c family putative transporter [Actinoplanes ovalisporus]MBM2623874.1 hypothetical protein [Actinoplanes ovalisporus]